MLAFDCIYFAMMRVYEDFIYLSGNIGRSQAAAGLYNQTHPGLADSAGMIVDIPREKISDRPGAANIIAVMQDYGINISSATRTQLTDVMTDAYDKLFGLSRI